MPRAMRDSENRAVSLDFGLTDPADQLDRDVVRVYGKGDADRCNIDSPQSFGNLAAERHGKSLQAVFDEIRGTVDIGPAIGMKQRTRREPVDGGFVPGDLVHYNAPDLIWLTT